LDNLSEACSRSTEMIILLKRRLLIVGLVAALAAAAGWAVWRNTTFWNAARQTVPPSVAPANLGAPSAPGPSADEEGTLPAARWMRPPESEAIPQTAPQPAPRKVGPSRASPPPPRPSEVRHLPPAPSPPPEQTAQPRSQSEPGALPAAKSQAPAGEPAEVQGAPPLPERSPSERGDGSSPPTGTAAGTAGAGSAVGQGSGLGVSDGAGAASSAGPPGVAARVVPPRVITSAGTDYPVEAFRLTVRRQDLGGRLAVDGEEGTVGVRALVREDGMVGRVDVIASSGSAALDRAAAEAVKRWLFAPATRDGVPIDAYVTLRIRYVVR